MVVGEGPKPPAFKGFMSEELRMPKYEAVKRVKPGKQDSMYQVSWPNYDNVSVHLTSHTVRCDTLHPLCSIFINKYVKLGRAGSVTISLKSDS